MRNSQDTFEVRKRSFISTFSIYMTVPLQAEVIYFHEYFNCNCAYVAYSDS